MSRIVIVILIYHRHKPTDLAAVYFHTFPAVRWKGDFSLPFIFTTLPISQKMIWKRFGWKGSSLNRYLPIGTENREARRARLPAKTGKGRIPNIKLQRWQNDESWNTGRGAVWQWRLLWSFAHAVKTNAYQLIGTDANPRLLLWVKDIKYKCLSAGNLFKT
jgi:hypothetical protein